MVSIENIKHEELQKILAQLDQGIYNHQQWHNSLIRTLICRLPGDKHDMQLEAHKECRFGQWYYGKEAEKIADYPGFIAVGNAHKNMHLQACNLLINSSTTNSITPIEYDHFANSLEQLRLEIFSLKNEIENLVYNRDALTGAINRVNMPHILREQQELMKRQGQQGCLAMIDLDNFKQINDTYGHPAGDTVLFSICHTIMNNLRPYDKIFRYGGEEFLLSFPFTDLNAGVEITERIRKIIEQESIELESQKRVSVTVSIGLTLQDLNASLEFSIEKADKAMYEAKSSGKNCVKVSHV